MRFIDIPMRVTVPANGGIELVVMPKQDRAYRELTIWGIPESAVAVGGAAGTRNFSSQVFFGHTSQAGAAARVDDNVYLIYDPGDTERIWPANEPTSNPQNARKVKGFPITVRLVNSDATLPLVITVEFCAMTIDQG